MLYNPYRNNNKKAIPIIDIIIKKILNSIALGVVTAVTIFIIKYNIDPNRNGVIVYRVTIYNVCIYARGYILKTHISAITQK